MNLHLSGLLVQNKTEMHALVKLAAQTRIVMSAESTFYDRCFNNLFYLGSIEYMRVRKTQRQVGAMIGKSSLISSI